ncbi:unnamed protein product [Blepharisma stoltei]|uniref:Recombination activating protein 1 n=1 Tax=Blepharisma stoltei TaxID=1481888 RepID=A0AAU9K658_9CILI|nr:unnamed protein product [Blepharisma stoltei]
MKNTISEGKKRKTMSFIPESKYVLYVEFSSSEFALEFPEAIEIEGQTIWISHAGTLECSICKNKGHNEQRHEKVMPARNKVKAKKGKSQAMEISNPNVTSSNYNDSIKLRPVPVASPLHTDRSL